MATGPLDLAILQVQCSQLQSIEFKSQGGQKAVYSAVHAKLGAVALKVFVPNADVRRAQREVEAVQAITCRQIPRVFETFVLATPFGPCLALTEEWVDGESLRAHLDKNKGGLDPQLVLNVARDVLLALSRAESKQIVHRDVKPDNIVIRAADSSACLIDFGIARHLSQSALTASGGAQALYTPGYAPPEQFTNNRDKIDSRSDLFACGVTLYESLEGINPFRANTNDPGEILRRVQSTPLPAISKAFDGGGEFADLLSAMVRIRRSQRPRLVAHAYEWVLEVKL